MGKTRKALMFATIAVACVAALGLAACGGSSGSSSSAASSGSTSAASSAASPSAAASSTAASAPASSTTASSTTSASALSAADLTAIDVEVALDDFEGMKALSKDIQNGQATGKVVKIDGYVLNFAKGMSYSISQKSASSSESIGTVFVIEGAQEDAYPTDGKHIVLTGKVVDEGSMKFTIHTLSEFVEVVG